MNSRWVILNILSEGVPVYCTTQLELRVQRSSDVGLSSCAVPTYYYGVYIFFTETGAWRLDVSLEIECSLQRDGCRVH